jgi:hypothetical protein
MQKRSLRLRNKLLRLVEKAGVCSAVHVSCRTRPAMGSLLSPTVDWFRSFGINSVVLTFDGHFMRLPQ